jgi:hypothetical protein
MLKSCFLDQRRQPSYQPSAPLPSRCCAAAHACVRARARCGKSVHGEIVSRCACRAVSGRCLERRRPIQPHHTRLAERTATAEIHWLCPPAVRTGNERRHRATSKSHCLASRALGRVAAAGSSPALGGRRLREAVRPLSHQVGAVLQRAVRRCNAAVLRCRTREQHIGSAQPFRPMEEATEPFHRSLTVAGGGGSAGSSGGQDRGRAGGGVGSERRSQRSLLLGTRRGQGSFGRGRSAARKPERRAEDDPPMRRKKTTRPRHMRREMWDCEIATKRN